MPYNPGSAYPRKTTYVPPVYGEHSFQRALNAPDFTPGYAPSSSSRDFAGAYFARNKRLANSGHSSVSSTMDIMSRNSVAESVLGRARERAGLRQNQGGASTGSYLPGSTVGGVNPNKPRQSALAQQKSHRHPHAPHAATPQVVNQRHEAAAAMESLSGAVLGSEQVGRLSAKQLEELNRSFRGNAPRTTHQDPNAETNMAGFISQIILPEQESQHGVTIIPRQKDK